MERPALANELPEVDAIRQQAVSAGGQDPLTLRFQIVEFDRYSGEKIGVPCGNIGFRDAVVKTRHLIEARRNSHFLLEPVGFIQ